MMCVLISLHPHFRGCATSSSQRSPGWNS